MKTKTKLLLLLLVSTLLFNNVKSENKNRKIRVLSGRVIDINKIALPGATIEVESESLGTASDVDGYFKITEVPEGEFKLKVSYLGYETKIIGINSETTNVKITLSSGSIQLGEVFVGSSQQSQARALNHQRAKNNISNIISAEQTGKFPDSNIGDALKRVPSVNVTYDQGEARFFQIRGTSARLNSVMLDGGRIPSAEGETRAVQLDLIPTDMVQTIEVNKAVTPDMDADAIGGAVNLITRSAPSDMRISATLGSGYNMMSEKMTYNGSAVFGNRFLNKKLGVIFSGSYHHNNLGSDNIEGEWDLDDNDKAYLKEFQIRKYNLQRIRKSVSAAFDYKIGTHTTLKLKSIFNHRDDYENRFRFQIKDIETEDGITKAELRRQTKGGSSDVNDQRLERQIVSNTTLNGEHNINSILIDWSVNYARASEKRPDERYINYRIKDAEISTDLSNSEEPKINIMTQKSKDLNNNWSLKELSEENQNTFEEDIKGKLNIEIPLMKGEFQNKIKVGAKYVKKYKKRDNDFFKFKPEDKDAFNAKTFENLSDKTKDDFLAGDYNSGHFVDNKYLGSLDLNNSSFFSKTDVKEEYAAKNYNATEEVTSAYIKFDQKVGDKLSLIAGLRVEKTDLSYTGNRFTLDGDDEFVKELSKDDSYTNFLPGLHAKYAFDKKTILRFAYTNTLARPNYYHLVPYEDRKIDNNEISIGNPELKPTLSSNIDIMFEKYFKSIGIISAGVFYKSLTDIIIKQNLDDYKYDGNTWDDFKKPVNAGDGKIYGFEVSMHKQLDFLPGILKNFIVYGNYTYTDSEVDKVLVEGRDNMEMPGTSKHTANASLSYENEGLSIRASINYASEYLDEDNVGESKFFDVYYDKVFYLDINASYKFKNGLSIFAEANNLTNQPLVYYQGNKDRLYQSEYYDLKFNLGIKFDF